MVVVVVLGGCWGGTSQPIGGSQGRRVAGLQCEIHSACGPAFEDTQRFASSGALDAGRRRRRRSMRGRLFICLTVSGDLTDARLDPSHLARRNKLGEQVTPPGGGSAVSGGKTAAGCRVGESAHRHRQVSGCQGYVTTKYFWSSNYAKMYPAGAGRGATPAARDSRCGQTGGLLVAAVR